MKNIGIILSFIAITIAGTGCKKYLDVNKNPNYPADVTQKELLPAAEIFIGQVYGNYFQVVGGVWAQYWTQNPNSSQYRQLEQYQPGPESADRAWAALYAGALPDLQQIVAKSGTAENTRNYTAIAKILQGYTFELLTDNFGDVPFSEALQGQSGAVTSPKYDAQEAIYNGIIALVKEGRDMIAFDADGPGTDDLIYHGDMTEWAKFANTLLLRMYLRLAYIKPGTTMAGIAELQSDPNGFLDAGETGQIKYISSSGNTNPLYSEISVLGFTQNIIASATAFDYMLQTGDPRIDAFYANGSAGLEQGFYNIPNPGTYATPSSAVGADANDEASATAPVKLLSSYESLFLQAEAAIRQGQGAVAADLYAQAVAANFAEYDLTGDDAQFYVDSVSVYPTGGSMEEQVQFIITEKWLAMNGNQTIEAWTEWRRTGYPDFFTISRTTRIGNQFPQRIPYPEAEITRNLNFPGQKDITQRVWWDVN